MATYEQLLETKKVMRAVQANDNANRLAQRSKQQAVISARQPGFLMGSSGITVQSTQDRLNSSAQSVLAQVQNEQKRKALLDAITNHTNSAITPITMAQTAANLASGTSVNAFQSQKESPVERVADTISSGALGAIGGTANAIKLATTGKYSPSGLISRGIDKVRGTNYTEQNAAAQKTVVDKIMDKSRLATETAKRGLGKAGQVGVDIGNAATQLALVALTGNAIGAASGGAGAATGAITKGVMAAQQGGQGAYDAEKAGAGEGAQALYGLLQGATAYATEGISNVGAFGKIFGNGAFDSKLEQASAKAISKFISSDAGRAVANRLATGAEAGLGEALEQNIQDALTPIYQKLTYDKDATWNAEDMLYNGLVAGALGGIVGSAGKNNLAVKEKNIDAEPALRNFYDGLKAQQEDAQVPAINSKTEAIITPSKAENAVVEQAMPKISEENILPTREAVDQPVIADATLPQGTGAMDARFPYREAPTQSKATESLFTNEEHAAHSELNNSHKVYSDAEAEANAAERLAFDYDGEKAELPKMQSWDKADEAAAYHILDNLTETARKSSSQEDWSKVTEWKKVFDQKSGTEAGQLLQGRKKYVNTPDYMTAEAAETLNSDITRKLSPQKKAHIIDTVYKQSEAYNGIATGDTDSLIKLIEQNNEIRRTTGLISKRTSGQMDKALHDYADRFGDNGAEQVLRDVASAQIRSISSDYQKLSPLEAIKSFRVQSMLSKISTINRNLGGNNVFDPVETLSNNIAVPLDTLVSKFTGTRSISVDKSWFSKAKREGSYEGALKSFIEVGLDADVEGAKSKYEQQTGRTFKMTGNPLERFLSTWQKWESYALTTTDEWQKGGISAETERGLNELRTKGKISDEEYASRRATETAKQRTFQNDSAASNALLKLRDAGNAFSLHDKEGGSFGVGDVAMPFAKVPANIVSQGYNYSPAGIVDGTVRLAKVLSDAHIGKLSVDQQAKAVTNIGRGLNGTAGIVMFTALAAKGVINVFNDDDKNKSTFERDEGKTGTQFNLSALNRWIDGKSTDWKDGDTLISIGFLDPINAQMAAGAMISDAYKEDGTLGAKDIAKASLSAVIQSVSDLPAMSQINDLVNSYKYSTSDNMYGKASDAILQYGASQVSSFIPNALKGIATGTDDLVRTTKADTVSGKALNSVKASVPGLRQTLPASYDGFGNERTYTGNKLLDILNANILPGSITKMKQDNVHAEIERLAEISDENKLYPDYKPPKNFEAGDKKYPLDTAEQQAAYEKIGQLQYQYVKNMMDSSAYDKMSDEEKAGLLEKMFGYAKDETKRQYITDKGNEYKSSQYETAHEAEQAGISVPDYYIYKNYLSKIDANDSVTQLESAQALQKTDMANQMKGELWQLQNAQWNPEKNPYTGVLAQAGLPPEKNIEIMKAYGEIDKALDNYEKPYKGASADSIRRDYLDQWLSRQGYNAEQKSVIMEVYKYWYNIPAKTSKKSQAFVNANPMP